LRQGNWRAHSLRAPKECRLLMRVREYMTPAPVCIQRGQTLQAAHRLMREHGVRHLPVLEGARLVGVVSERDLYLLETLGRVDAVREPVSQAMSDPPFAVEADAPLDRVVAVMRAQRLGSAVVMDGALVAGIFTTIDALRALEDCLQAR
jgi:acetoin utilization protein AcuB